MNKLGGRDRRWSWMLKKNVENEIDVETIIHGLSGGFEYNLTHNIYRYFFAKYNTYRSKIDVLFIYVEIMWFSKSSKLNQNKNTYDRRLLTLNVLH